jgi:hypothetical protein
MRIYVTSVFVVDRAKALDWSGELTCAPAGSAFGSESTVRVKATAHDSYRSFMNPACSQASSIILMSS